MPKKLIEVALPLEAINKEAAREKSIRHGHPSTLHLWWARRPLAAARAVIWSSLVDDPSGHPEKFPTEEDQNRERERLFKILSDLVVWENSNDEDLLNQAKAEIMKYTDGNPPALLDPFSGGGAIPLEAQRLGLEAHAHDLNPVAVMINKAMIEIPPRFAGKAPVNPDTQSSLNRMGEWKGAAGLAEDVAYYGQWMKKTAFEKIGHLYPKVQLPQNKDGGEANAIAWIWARTVKCPNPACGCEMPLASSFVLSSKKNNRAYVSFERDGKKLVYSVKTDAGSPPDSPKTARGVKFKCVVCGESPTTEYIKNEARSGRMGAQLMAVVAESRNGRQYCSPDLLQQMAAQVERPDNYPDAAIANNPRDIRAQLYGLYDYADLFTPRQLTMLTTFSDLISEAQKRAEKDAVQAGMENDFIPLSEGGAGATAYGEAVGVYLALVIDKMADYHSSICSWHSSKELIRNTFGRQAIPMTWDYAETNPFSHSAGCFDNMVEWVTKCLELLPASGDSEVCQFDAQSDCGLRNIMVSTDPPYYDNIGYADLSDYFYIWLRQSLKKTYPNLFRTMLVPKAEELIANPYRHEGSNEKAKDFFEDGMMSACRQFYAYSRDDIPVTIYYAYKQSDTDEEEQTTASSGWETMLSAIINAGFAITGTWPMRTEMANRAVASGTNALASSIVLVCRKRDENARTCTRRDFVTALKRELKPAIQKLQQSNIAPVDMAQSAIGPGIGVFSRYKKVLEADGSTMSVRSALQIINQELDLYFSGQDSVIDADSRLCVELFTQYAFNTVKFGDADILARAKGTSVAKLAGQDILYAAKGDVRLLTREELPDRIDSNEDNIWLLTQQLTRAMETGGIVKCAEIVAPMFGNNAEEAKNLAYRLYSICERKNWAQEAYAYNALVVAWPEIQSKAAEIQATPSDQMSWFN